MQYGLWRPLGELGNVVADGLPGGLIGYPCMRLRLFQEGCVQASEADSQYRRRGGKVHIEGTATVATECAELAGRGFEFADQLLAAEDAKVRPVDGRIGGMRRAAGFAAAGAVAVAEITQLCRQFVVNTLTQATSQVHWLLLDRKLNIRRGA